MSISIGDDPETVAFNRRHAASALGAIRPNLCMVKQTHSNHVHVLTRQPNEDVAVEADAMVTNLATLTLGILTADCTPILLADPQARVVGAAHAGWRGAVDGIIGNTVASMVQLGAEPGRIVAAYGPTITAPNYEVGAQFRADFLALHPGGAHFFCYPTRWQAAFRPARFRARSAPPSRRRAARQRRGLHLRPPRPLLLASLRHPSGRTDRTANRDDRASLTQICQSSICHIASPGSRG